MRKKVHKPAKDGAEPGKNAPHHDLLTREAASMAGSSSADDSRVDKPAGGDCGDTDGVPYDRGWAWMVLLGSVVNYSLISAYNKSMGVVFVELLQHFQAPASQTALLFAIRGGVLSVAGMFIMNAVIGRLGCRKTALIGGVLISLSAILSSLANSLILLICLQAVLLGISDCMLGSTGEVLTACYFKRRRFVAMSVIKASSSLGSMSYPPLLTHLVSRYGLRGALLLTGALSLHALPASLLLRPTSFFSKKRPKILLQGHHLDNEQQSTDGSMKGSSRTKLARNRHYVAKTISKTNSSEGGVGDELICVSKEETLRRALLSEMEARFGPSADTNEEANVSAGNSCSDEEVLACYSVTEGSARLLGTRSEAQALSEQGEDASSAAAQQNASPDNRASDHRSQNVEQRPPLPRRLKSVLTILDFSLFRRPSFTFLFLYYMFSPNINVGLDYLPALAEQQGMSKAQAAQLLSIVGGLDLLSRLSAGLLANLGVVPVPALAGVALTVLGTVYQCTRWLTSFGLLVVLAVAQGILAGLVNGLVSMIILHVVGLPRLAKGIGFQLLAEGAFSSAFHPLMGYIRDRTGSYVAVYHVTGCCLLAAAVLLLCEELIRKREGRPTEDEPS